MVEACSTSLSEFVVTRRTDLEVIVIKATATIKAILRDPEGVWENTREITLDQPSSLLEECFKSIAKLIGERGIVDMKIAPTEITVDYIPYDRIVHVRTTCTIALIQESTDVAAAAEAEKQAKTVEAALKDGNIIHFPGREN